MSNEILYEVEIQGHEPPFKWQVFRSGIPGMPGRCQTAASGHADSHAEACFDAREAAVDVEYRRKWETTKTTVPLFHTDAHPPEWDDNDLPVVDRIEASS